ncbi:MAG: aldo/keto reductase [Gemmatimonadales bacterium]|jgi:aryl-alcohol dehydrogenase-like predicted oxidoreductase|nr:MAG: aldo/keto reductase [Gemmatimonadales bacterium]
MTEHELNRRDFVKVGAAGAAAVFLQAKAGFATESPAPMPARPLGRTGHDVKLFSLGGQAALEQAGKRDESVAIINRAIDLGVNYIDTAAAYGRGLSQRYIGDVMATRRHEVFLASKTHDRTYDGSMRLLDESLRLLQTDHLDLWQLHRLGRADEWEQIRGPGGALEALERARREGLVRFLGVTGHYDPAVLMQAISDFEFDTILMALNAADPHYLPFTKELLPLANEKDMGVIAMKIPARGRLFREGGLNSMREAMHWVLSQPVSTVIVGCDTIEQLEENVAIAAEFQPAGVPALQRISALTAGYAKEAQFYKKGARA